MFVGAVAAILMQAAGAPEPPPAQPPRVRRASPNWLQRPTAEQFSNYYPVKAAEEHVAGKTVLSCIVRPGGRLGDCRVDSEQPSGFEFGKAGLELAAYFAADGVDAGGEVRLPLTFVLPNAYSTTLKRVRDPSFTEARVDIDCRFTGPVLDNCVTRRVEPAGSKMEQVALELIARMDMTPQRDRVGRITIPFHFTPEPLPTK